MGASFEFFGADDAAGGAEPVGGGGGVVDVCPSQPMAPANMSIVAERTRARERIEITVMEIPFT
jgi:hypothetical protein